MIRKYLLPLLAILGVVVIIIAIILDNRPKPPAGPPVEWPEVPFAAYVAGAGIVEAGSGNVALGTSVQGIVTEVYVTWGERVEVGDRLFKIDDRELQAQRPKAIATMTEADAKRLQAMSQLRLAESVPDQRAVSRDEIGNRRAAVAIAQAAWQSAKAGLEQQRLEIDRLTVRARSAGKILQINIHPGEFAQTGPQAKPLLLFGDDQRRVVRVDVDEFDASRIVPGAAAVAFVRSAPHQPVRLQFERIEPYVVPKTTLTGNPAERVDSRVLQVIYRFDAAALPIYLGQQMDVYIQTAVDPALAKSPPAPTSTRAPGSAP